VSARELDDKVVVVTGGSRGIGRAIVLGAAARGARVVFCAREIGEAALAVQAEAEQLGGAGCALAVRADIACEADVEALFDVALARFGRVDAAINNAAISRNYLLVSLPVEEWDEIVGVNLTGAFLVARRAVREFLASGRGGHIVSVGSLVQNGAPSNVSYSASKGGLVGLTRALAREYGPHGIYANLIVAGFVDTQLSSEMPEVTKQFILESCPQRRKASADEIAAVVLWLASARSAGVNGEALPVTGGLMQIPV
jgi:3-oxoacyl-[acyl-carrier protein] reductase